MTHPGKSSRSANRRLSKDYLGWGKQPDDLRRSAFTSGLVVLDANVLLALYEVGSAARDEVLIVLQNLSIRMWVPHQAALEFSKNRQRVVVDRISRFRRVRRIAQSSTKEAVELLESAVAEVQFLRERNRTARSWDLSSVCLDRESLDTRLSGVMDAALEEISALEAEHDLRPEHMQSSDVVFHEIDNLLAGRIGSPLGSADLRSAVDEAINFRYPNKIPPGYHDTDKPTDLAAAGDYLLWWETLTRARNDSTIDSVLLVTSDSKPDWWEVDKKGKVVGPRPELVQEMRDEANKSLVLASLADLLDGAERYLLADVSQETVQQVREVQAEVSAASSSRVEAHASGFVNLPDISPMELEGLIALLLQAMGYSVNGAPAGADRGADFIARDDSSIVPGAIVVEVKRYRNPVAANIVRQTLGIMHSVGASRGLIIAIGGFTRAAIEEASRASIRLIGGRELAELLNLHLGIVAGIGYNNGDNHGETYE